MMQSQNIGWQCPFCFQTTTISQPAPPILQCLQCGYNQNQIASQKQGSLICQFCMCQNNPESQHCQLCQSKIQKQHQIVEEKMKECRSCKMDNYRGNVQCVFCGQNLQEEGKKQKCWYCCVNVNMENYEEHMIMCKETAIYLEEEVKMEKEGLVKIGFDEISRTTQRQRDAFEFVKTKAMSIDKDQKQKFQERMMAFSGKTQLEIEALHQKIKEHAPLIIHFNINTMKYFLNDTHYRNQFETVNNTHKQQEYRKGKQEQMFNKCYSGTSFQRVKYGVLNLTNDPKGVSSASSYGRSYFLLKPHVRNICTFTNGNSSSNSKIATLQYCFEVLNQMGDAELQAAFKKSQPSRVLQGYKEIQIHGPVEFKKDVEMVFVSKAQLNTNAELKLFVEEFCGRNGLEYRIIQ